MFCDKCGNKIIEGARFCSECGATVSTDAANEKAEEPTGWGKVERWVMGDEEMDAVEQELIAAAEQEAQKEDPKMDAEEELLAEKYTASSSQKVYENENTNKPRKVWRKTYTGSKETVFIALIKGLCYLFWIANTVMAALFFYMLAKSYYGDDKPYMPILWFLIGAVIGLLDGLFVMALIMVFLSLSENLAILTDNSVEVLEHMDKIMENQGKEMQMRRKKDGTNKTGK